MFYKGVYKKLSHDIEFGLDMMMSDDYNRHKFSSARKTYLTSDTNLYQHNKDVNIGRFRSTGSGGVILFGHCY